MDTANRHPIRRTITIVAFAVMLLVNILANALPLNGLNTGQVSNLYPNLFAPFALTFSIWGIIYVLLLLYMLYLTGPLKGDGSFEGSPLAARTEGLFTVSCFANAGWILAWQYRLIPLSMVLMVVILVCLVMTYHGLASATLDGRGTLFVKLPFSVYSAWIAIATCANLTVLCVSLGWDGMGPSGPLWTTILLLLGLVVGLVTTLRHKDIAYGLVFIWAYVGILMQHISTSGFAGAYPLVVCTLWFCLVALSAAVIYALFGTIGRRGQAGRH